MIKAAPGPIHPSFGERLHEIVFEAGTPGGKAFDGFLKVAFQGSRITSDAGLLLVRVSGDPTLRLIGSPKRSDRGAAPTSTLHMFETELLTQEENLVGLRAVSRGCSHRPRWRRAPTGSCSTWIRARARCMRRRKAAPMTGTVNPSAATRCCCSASTATVSAPRYGQATCIAPRTGTTCSCRKLQSYLHGHAALSRASSRQLGSKDRPMGQRR